MIRLLLIATIALSTISAYLAFKTRVRGVQCVEERESAEKKVQTTENHLAREKNEKKEHEAKAKEFAKKAEENKELAEKIKADLAKEQEEAAKIASQVKEKDAELSKLKEEMARQKPDEPKVTVAEMDAKVGDLRAQLDKAQQAAQEQEKRAEALAHQIEEAKKKKEQEIQKAITAKKEAIKNTVGQILAYNEGWNFVVVNIGDKQGVTPESQLEVRRDGKVIAKLRITQVQPTQTTAGIVFGNDTKRVKFQPGDAVVFSQVSPPVLGLDTARVP